MKNPVLSILCFAFLLSCTPKVAETVQAQPEPVSTEKENKMKYTYYVYEDGTYVARDLESEPSPIGGEEDYYITMYRSIRYPADARKRGIQGTVIVRQTIDETGRFVNAEVLSGIGFGCDEVALKAVSDAAAVGFMPAVYEGRTVQVYYDIPVKFSLN